MAAGKLSSNWRECPRGQLRVPFLEINCQQRWQIYRLKLHPQRRLFRFSHHPVCRATLCKPASAHRQPASIASLKAKAELVVMLGREIAMIQMEFLHAVTLSAAL